MALHPCCGGSLQFGCKLVAIIEMVLSIAAVIGSFLLLALGVTGIALAPQIANQTNQETIFRLSNLTDTKGHHVPDMELDIPKINTTIISNTTDIHVDKNIISFFGAIVAIGALIFLILSIMSVLLSILLFIGAHSRNLGKCRLWLIIKSILMVISLLNFISSAIDEAGLGGISSYSLLAIIFDAYCLWLVYEFIAEMREDQYQGGDMKRAVFRNN